MDTIALTITAFVAGTSAGATLAAAAWSRHHATVLCQTRADHRRQLDALFGRRDAATDVPRRRGLHWGRRQRTRQRVHLN